jgi:hypothetical protein
MAGMLEYLGGFTFDPRPSERGFIVDRPNAFLSFSKTSKYSIYSVKPIKFFSLNISVSSIVEIYLLLIFLSVGGIPNALLGS